MYKRYEKTHAKAARYPVMNWLAALCIGVLLLAACTPAQKTTSPAPDAAAQPDLAEASPTIQASDTAQPAPSDTPSVTPLPPTETPTATPLPSDTPTPSLTPTPVILMLTNWDLNGFWHAASGCLEQLSECWGDETPSPSYMVTAAEILVNPDWESPTLAFEQSYSFNDKSVRVNLGPGNGPQTYTISSQGLVEIYANGIWHAKQTYRGDSKGWRSEHIDLSAYKGQKILVRFSQFIDGPRNNHIVLKVQWYIENIRITPLAATPQPTATP